MDHRARRPLRPSPATIALSLLLAAALMALAWSCSSSPADLAGTYVDERRDVRMELKATGKGALSTPDDDISFTWERHDSEIWLHAKGGGVVVCAMEPDGSLTTDMPGVGKLRFIRR